MQQSDVKIRTKIIVIITVYTVLTFLVGGIGSNQLLFIGNELNRISGQFFPISLTIDSIKASEGNANYQFDLYQRFQKVKEFSSAERKEVKKRFFEAHRSFELKLQDSVEALQETIESTLNLAEKQQLIQISLQMEQMQLFQQQLLQKQTEVIADVRNGKMSFSEISAKMKSIKSFQRELSEKIESLQNSVRSYVLTISESTQKNRTMAFWIVGTFFAVILTVSITFILLVTKLITNPIESLTSTIMDVEKDRDFTRRVEVNNKDEIGHIADAMNRLMQSIQITISRFGENAEILSASSEELTVTTRQVDGTAQTITESMDITADQLLETSSSMKQQASSMEEFARTMKEVKDQAQSSAVMAERGTETMRLTKTAMEKITDSSREIEHIMDEITEISQQTNSLALNAAIEASKAGAAGKGFAVVASQVRTLAERSNHSTVKSRELIDISKINVEEGSEVVHETEEMLNKMISQISDISRQVTYISKKMIEEEARAQKVSSTTEQITFTTQANAKEMNQFYTTLRQVDSTAASLKKMAKELQSRVSWFKV